MPHKLRKTRKKRGSRTHGFGRVGQHRGGGQRGGHGQAGLHKHKWTYVIKYEPGHFGKKGFTSLKGLRQKKKIINVGTLDVMAEKLSTEKEKNRLFIDLDSLGYTKLLGKGQVSKPLTVQVPSYSKSAAKKIKEAGGHILAKSEELKSSG